MLITEFIYFKYKFSFKYMYWKYFLCDSLICFLRGLIEEERKEERKKGRKKERKEERKKERKTGRKEDRKEGRQEGRKTRRKEGRKAGWCVWLGICVLWVFVCIHIYVHTCMHTFTYAHIYHTCVCTHTFQFCLPRNFRGINTWVAMNTPGMWAPFLAERKQTFEKWLIPALGQGK